MIVIQSERNDASANEVLEWIKYLDPTREVDHLSGNLEIVGISIKLSQDTEIEFSLKTKSGKTIENIDALWYKGGRFIHKSDLPANSIYEGLVNKIETNQYKELAYLTGAFYHALKDVRLNGFGDNFTNKINNLINAKAVGLCIPPSIISNCGTELIEFSEAHKELIIKDIEFDPIDFAIDKTHHAFISFAVTKLAEAQIKSLCRDGYKFPHVVFAQKYIDKRYEVRTFFLKGRCYSMAIFSQANNKTKVDFRNYDNNNPNRCVPFQLPQTIELQIFDLMKQINLESGSLDFLVDFRGQFFFLEVNPIGVFHWLSKKCNYGIEKIIAETLLNNHIS